MAHVLSATRTTWSTLSVHMSKVLRSQYLCTCLMLLTRTTHHTEPQSTWLPGPACMTTHTHCTPLPPTLSTHTLL